MYVHNFKDLKNKNKNYVYHYYYCYYYLGVMNYYYSIKALFRVYYYSLKDLLLAKNKFWFVDSSLPQLQHGNPFRFLRQIII